MSFGIDVNIPVPDAHLAAVLSQHGVVTLYTHDRDVRKFSFLEIKDPLV